MVGSVSDEIVHNREQLGGSEPSAKDATKRTRVDTISCSQCTARASTGNSTVEIRRIAKLGGLVKSGLSNVMTGRLWEARFRPQERLEELQVERHIVEFLYRAGDTCMFMNPHTYEQVEVPCEILGPAVT